MKASKIIPSLYAHFSLKDSYMLPEDKLNFGMNIIYENWKLLELISKRNTLNFDD